MPNGMLVRQVWQVVLIYFGPVAVRYLSTESETVDLATIRLLNLIN